MEELDVGVRRPAAVFDGEIVAGLEVENQAVEVGLTSRGRASQASQASQVLRAVETLRLRRLLLLWLLYRLSPGPGQQRHEAGPGVLSHGWGCLQFKQIFSSFKLKVFYLFSTGKFDDNLALISPPTTRIILIARSNMISSVSLDSC